MSDQDSPNRSGRSARPQSGKPNLVFAVVGLLIVSGIIYWGFLQDEPQPTEPIAEVSATPEPEKVSAEPIVPALPDPVEVAEPVVQETVSEPQPTAEVLPPPELSLAEANTLLPEAIASLDVGAMGETFVQQSNGLERGIAIVDNLRQGEVPYKLLPVGRPSQKFPFTDDGLAVTMDPAGFERYNGLAKAVTRIDAQATVALYQQFKAPINEAWKMLGYGDLTFDQALLQALESIMMAPETDPQARLIKREANWIYEDEALEALPALQKQLMRMGPDNAEKLKDKARELRGALLDTSE